MDHWIKERFVKMTKAAGLAALALLELAAAVEAQDTPEQKRDKKLGLPFLKKAPWITDYDQALEESKKQGKPIFGYFTRSYAP